MILYLPGGMRAIFLRGGEESVPLLGCQKKKRKKNACRLQQAEQVAVCLVRSGQHDNSNEQQQVLAGTYLRTTGLSAAASIAPLLHSCCSAAVYVCVAKKSRRRAHASSSSSSRNQFVPSHTKDVRRHVNQDKT